MTNQELGGLRDPRITVASALVGEAAVQIALIEAPGARPVGTGLHANVAYTGAELDVLVAGSPDSWRGLIDGESAIAVDLLGLRRSQAALPLALRAAKAANPNALFALTVTTGQLGTSSFLALRALLVEQFTVEWIVWCESGAVLWAVVVARPGVSSAPLVRLVDGRGLPIEETVGLIASCRKRQGGQAGRERVRRGALPKNAPWSWWDLSAECEAERKDTLELGESRPFSDVAQVRLVRHRILTRVELEDPDSLRDNHVGLVRGALIGRGGVLAPPSTQVPQAETADRGLLSDGDGLIAAISRDALRVAVVPPRYPPAVTDTTVLVVKLDASLSPIERTALLAYLRSSRFARSVSPNLSELNGYVRVTPDALYRATVPRFGQHLLDALERSAVARKQFSRWSQELEECELGFFDAPSFRSELPNLLARSRVAADRVIAALDVETLDGRVRQRFPHPLAFRFENISQMDHGAERVRETLACAEHLVLFLAFLGLANLGGGPTRSLQAWTEERGALSLDWGKADTLLRQAAAQAAKLSDPMAVAIPEFARLHGPFSDPRSGVNEALRELRAWRNDDSHLARCTPTEVQAASERFFRHLRVLFEAASLLTETPLVEVEDYERDQVTEERRARFAYLVGVSAAFRRSWEPVETELTRKHLAIRDVHGRLHPLYPWLIRRTCEKCQHAETFILSKFDHKLAKYVAMESGHALNEPALAGALTSLIARQRPTR